MGRDSRWQRSRTWSSSPPTNTDHENSASHALSCSVLSNSLWPHELWPTRLLCPWDFSGKILEWVALSSSKASSWPRDWTHMLCVGRWILYPWTTWEVFMRTVYALKWEPWGTLCGQPELVYAMIRGVERYLTQNIKGDTSLMGLCWCREEGLWGLDVQSGDKRGGTVPARGASIKGISEAPGRGQDGSRGTRKEAKRDPQAWTKHKNQSQL